MTIEAKASIIAAAVKASNGGTISQEAAKQVLQAAVKDGSIAADEALDAASLFMNLSALNQQLEKAGLIAVDRERSALMRAVGKELGK